MNFQKAHILSILTFLTIYSCRTKEEHGQISGESSIYDSLQYFTPRPLGAGNWIGNLRWQGLEDGVTPLKYKLVTYVNNIEDGQINTYPWPMDAIRILGSIMIKGYGEIKNCGYFADYISVETDSFLFSLYFPWKNYGAIIKIQPKVKSFNSEIIFSNSLVAGRKNPKKELYRYAQNSSGILIQDGNYYLQISHNGIYELKTDSTITIRVNPNKNTEVAIAFHMNEKCVIEEAKLLFQNSNTEIQESRNFWNTYLMSCPKLNFEKDFIYFNDYINKEITLSKEKINSRILWHWWVALINVHQTEFNSFSPFIDPDKALWPGVWSNDGPETLCTLAHTDQKNRVRQCLINYIQYAINDDGILSWYITASGAPCYGRKGDTGKRSHGVPCIVHAVDYYVRVSGDTSILFHKMNNGKSLYNVLSKYIKTAFLTRDVNKDGLVDWSNLWETGWDDKAGPFFHRASLEEWYTCLATGSDTKIDSFYKRNSCPVTALVEQCYFLWALEGIKNMGRIYNDQEMVIFAEKKYETIVNHIRKKHWDENTGFYYDMDVQKQKLSKSRCLDGIYFLAFEKDTLRINRVLKYLNNKNEFALLYTPSLSANDIKFKPTAYWSGGYWPREALYLGHALNKCGYKEKALEIILKAICSADGPVIAENINPVTGVQNTRQSRLAYNSCLNLALLELVSDNKNYSY